MCVCVRTNVTHVCVSQHYSVNFFFEYLACKRQVNDENISVLSVMCEKSHLCSFT